MGVTRCTGTTYPSGVHPRDSQSLVFCVMFCGQFFSLFFLLTIIWYVLRFTASDYPFGIFKLFCKGIKFAQFGILIYRTRTWSIYLTPWYSWKIAHLALNNNHSLNISEYESKCFIFCNSFIVVKFLYKLCLIWVKQVVGKQMGAVCSHGHSEFDICVIDT
jgi:hypothetical protein